MTFTTESGSVYQVDEPEKKLRQIKGAFKTVPPHRAEWRKFVELSVTPGLCALIVWPDDTFTRTTRVVSVTPCLN